MSHRGRPALVLDLGSGTVKAGLSGEDYPRVVFPPVVGRYRHSDSRTGVAGLGARSCLVGGDIRYATAGLSVTPGLKEGKLPTCDDLEQILDHSFALLNVDPSQHAVLMSELGLARGKELSCQVIFEKFQSPSLHLEQQAVLSLYGSGRCTGLVFLSGEGTTLLYPVYEGFTISRAVSRHRVTGGALTNNLQNLLRSSANVGDINLVRDIKEKVCSLAMDYQQEVEVNPFSRSYKLPDGKSVKIGNERFLCPEAYFQPHLLGLEEPGVHRTLHDTIQTCDLDCRRALYSNIIMSGGSTLIPGFSDRLMKEMSGLVPSSVKMKIQNISWRKYLVWTGGSIYSSIPFYTSAFVTKQEYEEHGLRVVEN